LLLISNKCGGIINKVIMSYFYIGTIILFISTAVYYMVFLGLIFYWHLKNVSYIIVPLFFTFKFFFTGFLVVSAVSLILENLPKIINLMQ